MKETRWESPARLNLFSLWLQGINFIKSQYSDDFQADGAFVFWGKAAPAQARAFLRKSGRVRADRVLVIAPRTKGAPLRPDLGESWIFGEHPLPGAGSFEAGSSLLEFFDYLGRIDERRLTIYLSGGASSLAWLKRAGMSEEELLARLHELYSAPLSIFDLNHERSKLCALKAGGAARWAKRLAPRLKLDVRVMSDVLPFPVSTVGSGPFFDGKVRHRVDADNATLISEIARCAREAGIPVLSSEPARVVEVRTWAEEISASVRKPSTGVRIWGGEPLLRLPNAKDGTSVARGGRQTHLAALLLSIHAKRIATGELEFLCMSTDGVDGASGASGAWLNARVAEKFLNSRAAQGRLREAIRKFATADALAEYGALVPSVETGVNVQDVVIARMHRVGKQLA